MDYKKESEHTCSDVLYEYLNKLTENQFKVFYAAFVHYFVNYGCFITRNNMFNLWCELNQLCHEFDEGFPEQFDDHRAMISFCHFRPYYFIDRLPLYLVSGLFADYIEDRVDVLINFVKTLSETGIHSAYAYINEALGFDESVDELVSETKTHIEFFKYK